MVRLCPRRLHQERPLADLPANNAFGLEVLERLDYRDQREIAEFDDFVLRLDLVADLDAIGLPAPE